MSLEQLFTGLAIACYVVAGTGAVWWLIATHRHKPCPSRRPGRRPDLHANCRCTILPGLFGGTSPELEIPAEVTEARQRLRQRGVEHGCSLYGHDFPRVEMKSPCQAEPDIVRGVCTRCGTTPDQAQPRLWEGDQA